MNYLVQDSKRGKVFATLEEASAHAQDILRTTGEFVNVCATRRKVTHTRKVWQQQATGNPVAIFLQFLHMSKCTKHRLNICATCHIEIYNTIWYNTINNKPWPAKKVRKDYKMTRICNILSFETEKEAMAYAERIHLSKYAIRFNPETNYWEVTQILYI